MDMEIAKLKTRRSTSHLCSPRWYPLKIWKHL